jgi:hypothetical protein
MGKELWKPKITRVANSTAYNVTKDIIPFGFLLSDTHEKSRYAFQDPAVQGAAYTVEQIPTKYIDDLGLDLDEQGLARTPANYVELYNKRLQATNESDQ